MIQSMYQFDLGVELPLSEVRDTLRLAVLAAEAIHGQADLLLDASYAFGSGDRTVRIDGSTPAARDLARLFAHFLGREFGPSCFVVERFDSPVGHRDPVSAEA